METPESSQTIYIPAGAYTLDKSTVPLQIRLGIQGPPKCGKTYAGLTFPKPIAVEWDRGLVSHQGRTDVVEVPFWQDEFVDSIYPRQSTTYIDLRTRMEKITPPNRCDAILKWLATEGRKIPQDHTLLLDGSTGIQTSFHRQYWTDPGLDNDGKIKPYEEWGRKIKHFQEIADEIKALNCHVIYIAHETDERDKKHELTGRKKALLSGAFVDELASHFTDWYRAHAIAKPINDEERSRFIEKFQPDNFNEWMTTGTKETVYLWQTQSDEEFVCGTSLLNAPKFVLAHYSVFNKYKRKSE